MQDTQSEAKAKKKSAFSCEPCRQRKVKCAGEQPRCSRCTARNDQCAYKLSPTLSYTQRLEARVYELERTLKTYRSKQTPPVVPEPTEPRPGSPFEGLRLDASGEITYQSSTSFFEPATGNAFAHNALPNTLTGVESCRKRLVQNTWEQRSLEIFAETLSLSNICSTITGAGFNLFSISSIVLHSSATCNPWDLTIHIPC
jgi:hypothetical protein